MNYYAKYEDSDKLEIAVFDSRKYRNAWIKYKDDFSRDVGAPPKPYVDGERRISVTYDEVQRTIKAHEKTGHKLEIIADNCDPKVKWLVEEGMIDLYDI